MFEGNYIPVTDVVYGDVNLINDMLVMQMRLDKEILEKKEHADRFSFDNLDMAIIDEIGELTHELKGEWCWWKNQAVFVDEKRVLEELVDVWHFVLMKHYKTHEGNEIYSAKDYMTFLFWNFKNGGAYRNYTYIRHFLSTNFEIDDALALTYSLGFTLGDVYCEYLRKNQINHERVENGY